MKPTIPEPRLRVFYSKRKSIIISRTEAQFLLGELKKWLEPTTVHKVTPKPPQWLLDLPVEQRNTFTHYLTENGTFALVKGITNEDWVYISDKIP